MLALFATLNWFGGASEVAAGQGLGAPVVTCLHFFEGFTEAGAGTQDYTINPTLSVNLTTSLQILQEDVFEPTLSLAVTPAATVVLEPIGVDDYTIVPTLSLAITPGASVVRESIEIPTLSLAITPAAVGDSFVEVVYTPTGRSRTRSGASQGVTRKGAFGSVTRRGGFS